MAELFAKDTGTCRGTGGSMHIYDVDTHFQGGWALVSEQLPYAAGARTVCGRWEYRQISVNRWPDDEVEHSLII